MPSHNTAPAAAATFARHAPTGKWDEDFELLMQRLYKWWNCAIPQPGETVEEQMERMEICYRQHGIPAPMTEQERKDLEQDIDDIIGHTGEAPASVGQTELFEFRETMFEILLKLG
ncbi:MAG: hypothetical protein IT438_08675 [Phycisphaerales bacterium]|nr:hypothetical protein [Phycisphaerales bacterium]